MLIEPIQTQTDQMDEGGVAMPLRVLGKGG